MQNKDEYMEFIFSPMNDVQGLGPAGGYGAFNQKEIYMPVSENEQLACIIHQVEFYTSHVYPADGVQVAMNASLSKHFRSSFSTIGSDFGMLAYYTEDYGFGLDSGTLSDYWTRKTRPDSGMLWKFDPPLLIAQRTLYHGARTYNMPEANQVAHLRIGYTLRKVSKDAFIAALVG